MTQDEIIEMAKLAGWEMDDSCVLSPQVLWYIYQEQLEAFAKLVRDEYSFTHAEIWLKRIDEAIKAEREACAVLVEREWSTKLEKIFCDELASYIRARGEA